LTVALFTVLRNVVRIERRNAQAGKLFTKVWLPEREKDGRVSEKREITGENQLRGKMSDWMCHTDAAEAAAILIV
jgi:hypothetical protein